MKNKLLYLCFVSLFTSSCGTKYTPEEVANSYCECVELSEDKKTTCVKEWSIKYKGSLTTTDEHKQVNYNMIECNGFEGDNDFYLKLMRN